tara:strand:+ start:530 stop:997 length:468 start_codon:yes stop_codon:yes gene_type:complete
MHDIKISFAKTEDSYFFYYLRNELCARNNSQTTSFVSTENHDKWYNAKLLSSKDVILVGRLNTIRIGVCRFEFIDSNQFIVSYSLVPAMRGKRLSYQLLYKSIHKLKNIVEGDFNLIANVRDSNIASRKLLESLNFKEVYTISSDHSFIKYTFNL